MIMININMLKDIYKIFIKLSTISTQIFVTPPDGSLYRVGGESECLLFQSSLGSSQVS